MADDMANYDGVLWETELRLGLPGGGGGGDRKILLPSSVSGKRGFSETVDLKLNLGANEMNLEEVKAEYVKDKDSLSFSSKPPAKAQVVGWPPVRSFRRNVTAGQKRGGGEAEEAEKGSSAVATAAVLVKVSMDGAPYLRKVDLKMFKSYQQLSDALGKMFSSFTTGKCDSQGMLDFINESKLMDLLNSTDYVPTYEDKDGDWMLVGDVPWEMFVDSCKRLRIMKATEAKGLAPRALEKCKSRG